LFANVIHTGKRARTETPISRYTTSISHAGAALIMEKLGQRDVNVVLLGAGEMAVLAAQALQRFNIREMTFINRTDERANALAEEFGGTALGWFQLEEALVKADAVICATAAPHTIIYRRDIEAVLGQREGRPLVIMDIAVPRDVEATVRGLPGVQYYDIDDLQSVVDTNIAQRRAAAPQVEAIIQQETMRFAEWFASRQVTPVIKDLREWGQNIAEEELLQTLNRLSDADERTRQVVSQLAHRLVNRLLHEPTARLRLQANEGNGYAYAHAVRELFALNIDEVELDTHECQCDGLRVTTVEKAEPPLHACNLQCIVPMS
jgi:glutamyl-tRNA reductase